MKTRNNIMKYMKNHMHISRFLQVLLILIIGIGQMDAHDWADGRKIYFNIENCTDFGSPYFRIGHGSYNNAYAMSLVAGTKYLYAYTKSGAWSGYDAFSVADNAGWQEGKTIYQPYNDNGIKPDGDYKIRKQTDFQKYSASSDVYLKITSTGNTDKECQYYHVNGITSGDGQLATLPSYSVSYSKTGNGTLSVTKYNGSTYDAFTSGNSVNPTQIMKIIATPSDGYALTDLTITGATQIDGGNTYFVTENTTISATFTYIEDFIIHVKNTNSWGGIKVYQWNAVTGATGTAFPGDAATSWNSSSVWYNVTLSTAYTKFVICNSSATVTKSGDIPFSAISENGCYTTATTITSLPTTDCAAAPTVTTATASSINLTGATLGGNITNDGSDVITDYGYYYSTNSSLSSANAADVGTKVQVGTDDHDGSFSNSQTGLTIGTTYYVIAYAVNVHGTGWGAVQSFSTTVATLSLSGTADYTNKTMTITPTTNINAGNGYSGDQYICCECTDKPGGADNPTITWNSATKKIEISGTSVSGDYEFNVKIKPASSCSGDAFYNADEDITITMKDFVDYSGLTINHEIEEGSTSYMTGDGASATPYFIYLKRVDDYGKLELTATLAASLADGDLYYSVNGEEISAVSLEGTAASITMDLPNQTVGADRETTIKFYHKLDGQRAPAAKQTSATLYYTVSANPVVTLSATYNGTPITADIPQSAEIDLSATATNIPVAHTFTYRKGDGAYSATTTYSMDEDGTTTMYAKTTYLGDDWIGSKDITTYAANSVTLKTTKTDMYGDDSHSSTTHLFKSTGEEYTAPDIPGYTFSDWSCSNSNVRVSDDSGDTWKGTSTNQTVYVKVTATGATLTAHYQEAKRIYFDNSRANWDGNIYVYLFSGDSWYNDYNGTDENGPGVVPRINRLEYGEMTRIGESDIYYYEYSYASSFTRVAFSMYDQHDYKHLYDTKGVWRTDFSTCNPCYVAPATSDQTKYDHGDNKPTYYYNNGYWRRYMPTYSQYSLYFTDGEDSGDKGKFVPKDPSADGEEFVLEVLRGATTTYHFNLPNTCGTSLGNNGTMTKDDCTDWVFEPTSGSIGNCAITTTAGGRYKFILNTSNGQVKLSVEYPLNTGDYQVYYTDKTGKNNNYSEYISKNTGESDQDDIVSFFVKKTALPTYQVKRCTGFDGSGDPTWENVGDAQSIFVDRDSVYNFVFRQPAGGASISKQSQEYYSGNYYIRTDGAAGGWANYLSNPDNKMKHTDKPSALAAGYNYYYLRWIGDASGNSTANVKFTIATDYNSSISQEFGNDPADGSLSGGQVLTGKGANVRFTYNPGTNEMTRTCIGGSAHDANYLVINGTNLKTSTDGAWGGRTAMTDVNDWIYSYELKATDDATITLESHYNNKYVTVLPSKKIFDVDGGGYYGLKVIYDYKTNEVVASYVPDGDISSPLTVDVDIMFIRKSKDNHEDADPTTLSFSGSGKITGAPKTLYGALEFEKDYVRAEGSYAGLSSKRPERSTYWISFPFDVRIKDVFGLGEYTDTWIIRRYRGDLRASRGWFLDTPTFWEYMDINDTLFAGQGYVLSIDCEAIQWPNSITTQYLYFPSKDKISDITDVIPSSKLDVPAHTCTITSPADRRVQDSNWNLIGIPGFTTGWGKAEADVSVVGGDFHYFYTWDASTNTLSSENAQKYSFDFMHSYMVQYAGLIDWSASEPSLMPAKRSINTKPTEKEFRLDLKQGTQEADHAYITLIDNDNVTTGFDMNTDLVKMQNANRSNIYTLIDGDVQAAANCLPISDQTTQVPVGVQIAADGEYTFSMPDGTSGVGVTLVDNVANTRTNLSLMDYTVNLSVGTYDNRFSLEISAIEETPTDVEEITGGGAQVNGARKVLIDGVLYIVKDGKIYDARGMRVE